jgi:hypothetical protein
MPRGSRIDDVRLDLPPSRALHPRARCYRFPQRAGSEVLCALCTPRHCPRASIQTKNIYHPASMFGVAAGSRMGG